MYYCNNHLSLVDIVGCILDALPSENNRTRGIVTVICADIIMFIILGGIKTSFKRIS